MAPARLFVLADEKDVFEFEPCQRLNSASNCAGFAKAFSPDTALTKAPQEKVDLEAHDMRA